MAARKAPTRLPGVFKAVDTLLAKEIDPLLVKFQATEPAFYADYKASRIIVDRPGGRAEAGTAAATATTAPATGTTPAAS